MTRRNGFVFVVAFSCLLSGFVTETTAHAYSLVNKSLSFIAPTVQGVANVTNPDGGLIVFDSDDGHFKGKTWASGWTTFGSAAAVLNVSTVTSGPYALLPTDDVVIVSNSTTVNLPAASSSIGKVYDIHKADSTNIVTITPNGTDTINGSAGSVTLNSLNDSVKLISASSGNWQILVDNRTVAARYTTTSTVTIGPEIVGVNWTTVDYDTHNGMDTAGTYTVPIAGTYEVCTKIKLTPYLLPTNQEFYALLVKNHAIVESLGDTFGNGNTVDWGVTGCAHIRVNVGDTLAIWGACGEYVNLDGIASDNWISIVRVGN